ncbi:S9 family peptidase [Paludibacter sp. 221]|uniref:S9 family peptidase n=1 Tax=Paludibacter sp. 221 TaxID=2302939 RepID=UPI0013D0E99C|nr:prolyl oligopeptidase family serine peptidase [Paludibacter sp. 221]NDV46901.1 S9 family peptidase [Paludibacter sp. 221]
MKNSSLILICCFATIFNIYSQKKQNLPEISAIPPVTINLPLEVDSTNLKGEKFTEKDLLKMPLTIPSQNNFSIQLQADTAGYFYPTVPANDNTTFQLFSFYINADRYAKGTLKVTSPNMLEVYIDDKLEKSKTTKENKLDDKNNVTTKFTAYPENKRVVIKLLANATDSVAPALKVSIENENKDSLTNYQTTFTDKRIINFKDMMLGKRVTSSRVSPNGNYILIWYRESFGEKSESSTELYNIKTGNSTIIDMNGQKRQLNWMPESEKLYYVATTLTGRDLITIDPQSMKESVLAKNIPNVNIRFSPDEKSFFYTKQDSGEEQKGDLTLLPSPKARTGGYNNRWFICRYDLTSGLSQQLTFGSTSTWLNDISPDSKKILFAISEETITERPFSKSSMMLLDINTMTIDTLWYQDPFASQARFAPDGKKILITGSGDAFGGIGLNLSEEQISNTYNTSSFIMDLASKQIDPITKNFDPSISSAVWNKKDNLIYFRTVDKDFENIYTYNASNKTFTKLPLDEEVVRNFSLGVNSNVATYHGVSLSNSTKAYIYDLKKKKSTLIADPYKERLDNIELGEVNDWNFTNSDDVEIYGRYYLPPNFDSSKKYPLIVYYYGGTTPTARNFESSYPGHVYASQGYVVYVVQPSGTIGFGQKFAAMHVNAWGKRTAEDIIEGTRKFVSEHPYVNGSKIGCIGASYGGFMTMYLQTQTDMFAAAVSHAGISSISSYWGEGYWGYGYSSAASAFSYPWNNHELYVNQSPLFNADKINTPILLTHGTVDTNVPPGESIQMFAALKILGKPVEFIQVKDENHGVANYKRRIEWFDSIMAWFGKWLKEDDEWWESMYGKKK